MGSVNNAYMFHNPAAGASSLHSAAQAQTGDVQYDNFVGGPDTVIMNPLALRAEKDSKHKPHNATVHNNNSSGVAGLTDSDNHVVLTNIYINKAMVI